MKRVAEGSICCPLLVEMVKWVDSNGFELDDVHLSRPTLEDVFIELTGKKLRD